VSRDILVGVVQTGQPRNPAAIAGGGKRFISSADHPEGLCCPPTFCSMGAEGILSRVKSGLDVKLTISPRSLAPGLRMS
jgi:hypothetical protein